MSNPYHHVKNETAIEASSTTKDNTLAITAFFMFCGEFSEWTFIKGRKTNIAKSAKNNNVNKALFVYKKALLSGKRLST